MSNEQELLDQARKSIDRTVNEKQLETNFLVLEESMKELIVAKTQLREFTNIRNKAMNNLYKLDVTAADLSKLTDMSVQMVHRILK
jgi:hypothetical protein|tara:strand:- start:38 stop:295 length:258 start_codon:yes stop_codon:yes gene_type:complete